MESFFPIMIEYCVSLFNHFGCLALRSFQSINCWIGHFLSLFIFTGCLAETLLIPLYIKNVINNLEHHAKEIAIPIKSFMIIRFGFRYHTGYSSTELK